MACQRDPNPKPNARYRIDDRPDVLIALKHSQSDIEEDHIYPLTR